MNSFTHELCLLIDRPTFCFEICVAYDTNSRPRCSECPFESVSIAPFICLTDYGSPGSLFLFIDAVHCVQINRLPAVPSKNI